VCAAVALGAAHIDNAGVEDSSGRERVEFHPIELALGAEALTPATDTDDQWSSRLAPTYAPFPINKK